MEKLINKFVEKYAVPLFIFILLYGLFHGGRYYEIRYTEVKKSLSVELLDMEVKALKGELNKVRGRNQRLAELEEEGEIYVGM